jgi:hypothetical protein
MNTTMIKTKPGKTIMLQFDVHSGRPYDRLNTVVGTMCTKGIPLNYFLMKMNYLVEGINGLKKKNILNAEKNTIILFAAN